MERLEGTNALNQGAGAEPRAPPSAEPHLRRGFVARRFDQQGSDRPSGALICWLVMQQPTTASPPRGRFCIVRFDSFCLLGLGKASQ